MMLSLDIGLLLRIILPPILYALVLYLTSPYKSLNITTSFHFLLMGVFSMTTLYFISSIFPSWRTYWELNEPFRKCFLIIAPKEEFAKYLMFLMGMSYYKSNNKTQHLITYMFYFGMVGLGFALFENLGYVQDYGLDVLKTRTFTTTLLHMIVGMIFGYWVALGNIKRSKFKDRSVFGVICERRPKLKIRVYSIIGFLFAVTTHGLWNYNLSNPSESTSTIMISFILAGLMMVKVLANDLNTQKVGDL